MSVWCVVEQECCQSSQMNIRNSLSLSLLIYQNSKDKAFSHPQTTFLQSVIKTIESQEGSSMHSHLWPLTEET